MSVYFITGIDTDAGKTIVTGLLARSLARRGRRVITQKFIQTGCRGISEDILAHRRVMGIPPTEEDRLGTTCPYVFTYPASPHLAAEMDGERVDLARVAEATRRLAASHDIVLLEGAGGLYVPVAPDYFTIDYARDAGHPLILVTSARLGSINHTILSLEACRQHGIRVAALAYNAYPPADAPIDEGTRAFLRRYIAANLPGCAWIDIPLVDGDNYPDIPCPLFDEE
ncbi:MAG: dethiobiotin synthase [Odoribacteraceae bacterium]|jgi:dethiobiotin synthetase|nr:dethiobiotin synthase [Odoribacteraceae bacterium]